MKKPFRLMIFCLAAFLFLLPVPVFGAQSYVADGADLFTPSQEQALEEQAQKIAEQYDTNVLVITDIQSGFSDNYARDYIEDFGSSLYPEGYIAYMINMADRSYWVDAYGDDVRAIFTQGRTDSLADNSLEHLKDGDYYEAAEEFLKGVDIRLDIENSPMGRLKKPLIYKGWTLTFFLGSGIGAALIAGAWMMFKAAGHRDKKEARTAQGYQGNLNLRGRHDQFVRTYQTRVKIESDSGGSHGGFGGGSSGHTGSGGHF